MASLIVKGVNSLVTPTKTAKLKSSLQNRSVRCLLSPQKPSQPVTAKDQSPASDDRGHDGKVMSFDTPVRKSLSAKEFQSKNIDNYILGRGSYGLVVKGRYKHEHIAVKVISQCQEQTEMLRSEINALKLKHPNIIQVSKVTLEPDKNVGFVFMELYSNTNLEHILQCEVVNYTDKLRYLKQIGSALAYCHTNGIIHMDVKPKNVIVKTKNKTCKLCDFGSSVEKSDISRTDVPRKGTLKYTAPEILKGECPTEKSDVYSFGITMWQTIHQELPYDKEDLQQVVYKVVKHDYRPTSCSATLSSAIHQIYKACWQADPMQRPSMSQVLLILE